MTKGGVSQRSSQALDEIRGMSLADHTPGLAAAVFVTWSFAACWEGRRGQAELCSKGVLQFLFLLYTAVKRCCSTARHPQYGLAPGQVSNSFWATGEEHTRVSEQDCCSLYLFQSPDFLFIVMKATDADNLFDSIN